MMTREPEETMAGLPPIPPRLHRLPAYVAGRSALELCRERGVTDVVVLAANENPLGPPPAAIEAIRADAASAHLYPDSTNTLLRDTLAKTLDLDASMLVVANGAEHVLALLVQAFVDPGDRAVAPRPSFPVYRIATIAAGGEIDEVDLPGWAYDADAILAAVGTRTRLVFLASPNNPTGTYLPEAEVLRLLDGLPPGVLLVLDEAYGEYAGSDDVPDGLRLLRTDPRVVTVRTLSKAYGLAGLRVGYLVADPAVVDLTARVRPAFALNGLAERAGVAALADRDHLQRTVELNDAGRIRLQAAFAERGLAAAPSAANFVWVDVGDERVWDRLLDHGVVVRSGTLWGYPDYLRVTVGTDADIERFLAALDDVRAHLTSS